MKNKDEIRKLAYAARKSLTPIQIEEYSNIIFDKLKPFIENKTICAYMPTKYEVQLPSIDNAAYPSILQNNNMNAYRSNKFILNKYNILEPDINTSVEVDDFDVILVPLVAFDNKCNRLGHGKGYYDRFLTNKKGLKIGLAYEIQRFDDIPTEKNDIKLDYIITESNIYKA